ncbi:MAG: hypothetical protein CMD06_03295, partial [Flavobacteriales bacterium]|nr:hypothetical protein [Flavobacteriales bacterium]
MKKAIIIILILISGQINSQIIEPVKWNFSQKQISEDQIELYFKAEIEKKWHLYSQNLPKDVDAWPTSFNFINNSNFDLIGGVIEPDPILEYDPNFEIILPYFENSVTFKQKIKLKTTNDFNIQG